MIDFHLVTDNISTKPVCNLYKHILTELVIGTWPFLNLLNYLGLTDQHYVKKDALRLID
jgi:hypothetical protein